MSKATGARLLHKQLNALRRAGGVPGVLLDDPCEEDLHVVCATLTAPEGCPYTGGRFVLRLTFCEEYPARPPRSVFVTPIFHPNVSPATGEICVSALQKDWQPSAGLAHVFFALQSLLMNPNAESALNEAAGRMLLEDAAAFGARARLMAQVHACAPGHADPTLRAAGEDEYPAGNLVAKPAAKCPSADVLCSQHENAQPAPKRPRRL